MNMFHVWSAFALGFCAVFIAEMIFLFRKK